MTWDELNCPDQLSEFPPSLTLTIVMRVQPDPMLENQKKYCNNKHLHTVYSISGTLLRVAHIPTHLFLTTHRAYFINGETEAQRKG